MEAIGIKRIEGIHFYVHDLERARRFYVEQLGFVELGKSGAELERGGRQASYLFGAGDCRVLCSAPRGEGGRAARYLAKHPEGIGTLVFEVDDAAGAFELLESRGANPIDDLKVYEEANGSLSSFSIPTPFGSTTFRFVERTRYARFCPGFEYYDVPRGGGRDRPYLHFDHFTVSTETMAPAILFLEHLLGFTPYSESSFHTGDARSGGSGLRSKVMWDEGSGVKIVLNEPLRPHFRRSQVNAFAEQMRGSGVQRVAIAVRDIVEVVGGLRERGVALLDTPAAYYDALPERAERTGFGPVAEPLEELRRLGILVDGERSGRYLLQVLLRDAAALYGEARAGPFFFEIIERHGAKGFGEGNFRALSESMERTQTATPG